MGWTQRTHEELFFGTAVAWKHLAVVPVVEVRLAAPADAGRGVHVQAGAAAAGVVLMRGASGWLVWSRRRPYRDFRDALYRHRKEAGA